MFDNDGQSKKSLTPNLVFNDDRILILSNAVQLANDSLPNPSISSERSINLKLVHLENERSCIA